MWALSPALAFCRDANGSYVACTECYADLGANGADVKRNCHVVDEPIAESNILIRDPALHVDAPVRLRRFFCPTCGSLIDAEIVVGDAPPNVDFELVIAE